MMAVAAVQRANDDQRSPVFAQMSACVILSIDLFLSLSASSSFKPKHVITFPNFKTTKYIFTVTKILIQLLTFDHTL